jgi:CPA2 family monovalent cation:H+ antiporter-2
MGWSVTASLFLAAMLMVSSSAIISKVLDELNLTHERAGQLALGVTVFEDIVAVTMLTLLASLVQFGGTKPPPLLPMLGGLGAFIVLLALLSLLIIPMLLARLGRDAQPEVRTLVIAGILLSLSWLAVQLGYSLALGAFVFGVIVGSTRFKSDVESAFESLRQLFGAVFFVAVGMLVDFRLLREAWPQMLAMTALALVLRPFACSIGFLAVGNSPREAIHGGLALTPLGEFTFIIAQLGVESGILPKAFYPVAAGASLLTAISAPLLTRHGEALGQRASRAQPRFVSKALRTYQGWLERLRNRGTAGILAVAGWPSHGRGFGRAVVHPPDL